MTERIKSEPESSPKVTLALVRNLRIERDDNGDFHVAADPGLVLSPESAEKVARAILAELDV